MLNKPTLLATALCGVMTFGSSWASSFPSEPIRINVPFAPGGGTDFLSRSIANKMAEQTGWTIIVENRPGAAGTIAMSHVARSTPSGHELIIGQLDTLAIAPAIYPNVTWDPIKNFEPIGLMATTPLLIVSNATGPYQNLPDALAAAKAQPEKIDYASPGVGSISHLAVALLEQESGTKMQHIPYKGAGPAMTDLLGNRVSLYAASIAAAMPQVQSKNVTPLAVTGAQRSAALPDTPTVAELGYPNVNIDVWYGLFAPSGVDAEKLETLHQALNNALNDPEIVKLLGAQGLMVKPDSRDALRKIVETDVARWPAIVQQADVSH